MYAIVFDLDTAQLQALYDKPSWQNACKDICIYLEQRGFENQQGSTYFGDETVDPISCVLTVQDLARDFSWFAGSVRDIRMLKIEENNDIGPAIDRILSG
ncbi:MAG: hypothetical protein WBF53_12195 [Litorimonas sp.]